MCAWASTALAAGPRLMVKDFDGNREQLAVAMLEVNVDMLGDIADTEVTVTFKNTRNEILEGEFVMPLPKGATVSSYALDVNGKMREGVAVRSYTARWAYEWVKRGRVDPGYVEREEGNVYRTKIFPIPAGGTKAVRIGFVERMAMKDGKFDYMLPLDLATEVDVVKFTVNGKNVEAIDSAGVDLKRSKDGLKVTAVKARVDGNLHLRVAPPREPLGFIDEKEGYCYVFAPAENAEIEWKTDALRLVWDASGSRRGSDLGREFEMLDAVFAHLGNCKLSLSLLRADLQSEGEFDVVDGDWSALRQFLENVDYDGATDFSKIVDPFWDGDTLLVTDGKVVGGGELLTVKSRMIAMVPDEEKTAASLRYVVRKSGGWVVDHAADISWVKDVGSRFATAEFSDAGVIPIRSGDRDPAPAQQILSGQMINSNATTVKVRMAGSNRLVDVPLQRVESGTVRRLYGQEKLLALEADAHLGNMKIIEHCQAFGLVSDYTSLIVLERLSDYVKYRIPPPDAEMLAEYEKLVTDSHRSESKGDYAWRQFVRSWESKQQWHEKNFPWAEHKLMPWMKRHKVWLNAVNAHFDRSEVDGKLLGSVERWNTEARALASRRSKLQTNNEYVSWQKEIEEMVSKASDFSQWKPNVAGDEMAVTVMGRVGAEGKFQVEKGAKLSEVVKQAGGPISVKDWSSVAVYRGTSKTVYNALSENYVDVPLMPGDMVVVEQAWNGYGVADPFAAGPSKPVDHRKEPAVIQSNIEPRSPSGDDSNAVAGSPPVASGRSDGRVIAREIADSDAEAELAAFRKALENGDEVMEAYIKVRGDMRRDDAFFVRIAREMLAADQRDAAMRVLGNLLELEGDPDERQLSFAMQAMGLGLWQEAVICLERVEESGADVAQVRYLLAMAFAGMKENDEAGEQLNLLLGNPRDVVDAENREIAITTLNGWIANQSVSADSKLSRMKTFDQLFPSDLRVVVVSSRPGERGCASVSDPQGGSGLTYGTSAIGGRMTQGQGIGEYMIRAAVPGQYTVSGSYRGCASYWIEVYQNWGTEKETVKRFATLLDDPLNNQTLAEVEMEFNGE